MIIQTYDTVVIGGGLVGLITARELAFSGLKVAIFERKTVGCESSWAGGGILSPLYPWREDPALIELATVSRKLYPELARNLLDQTSIDSEWQQSGMLSLNVDDITDAYAWAEQHDFSIKQIGDDQLKYNFNLQSENSEKTLWLPEVAQIRNPRLITALKIDLIQSGVDIFENNVVNQLRIKGNKLHEIKTANGNFSAGVTVVANGAWANDLLPDINVWPVKGQMLCYQGPKDFLRHILLKDGIYIIPRKDGHILAGSTVEDAGFDKGTTGEARNLLSSAAEKLLPEICNFPLIGHWSGLRPATDSGIPYICVHPEIQGLYLNTGQFRNGILLAPGSARLLADLIMDRKPVINPEPYQFKFAEPASRITL